MHGSGRLPTVTSVKGVSLTWQQTGACRSGTATRLLPPDAHRAQARAAGAGAAGQVGVRGCPVRDECLEHAIRVDERYGIWGGLNQDERRLLRESA